MLFFTIDYEDDKMPNVKVQSSDGEVFTVDFEVIKQSTTIKTMVDDLSIDDIEDEIVPLPNVTAGILKKVMKQMCGQIETALAQNCPNVQWRLCFSGSSMGNLSQGRSPATRRRRKQGETNGRHFIVGR